ncbi:hypothetical protein LXA43DRAFT_77788 [Ganoderma leucocontextum]|nr:hypothetical protein LXA43DRAFT_77788 [Ganoderma leucocontextum]
MLVDICTHLRRAVQGWVPFGFVSLSEQLRSLSINLRPSERVGVNADLPFDEYSLLAFVGPLNVLIPQRTDVYCSIVLTYVSEVFAPTARVRSGCRGGLRGAKQEREELRSRGVGPGDTIRGTSMQLPKISWEGTMGRWRAGRTSSGRSVRPVPAIGGKGGDQCESVDRMCEGCAGVDAVYFQVLDVLYFGLHILMSDWPRTTVVVAVCVCLLAAVVIGMIVSILTCHHMASVLCGESLKSKPSKPARFKAYLALRGDVRCGMIIAVRFS